MQELNPSENAATEKKLSFTDWCRRILAILLAVSCVLTILYIVSGIQVKNSIRANVQPVVEELKEDSGAASVDVKIRAEPRRYRLPWKEHFHVFLTAHVDDLRRIGEDDVLKILNNGVEEGERERSYSHELRDYAIYTRSVEATGGETHPVFVTLTDGNINYSLQADAGVYSSSNNYLCGNDVYSKLNPPMVSPMLVISALTTVGLAALLLLFNLKKIRETAQQRKENPNPNAGKKRKTIGIIAAVIAVAAAAAVIAVKFIVIPTNRYQEAIALRDSGDVDGAYAILEELGGFKDSEEIRNEIDYSKAEALVKSGSFGQAYTLLNRMERNADAEKLLQQLEEEHPALSILLAEVGDVVTLGSYEQDNNTANGSEPIEWIVLSKKEDGGVYLLSKYVLDAQPFNEHNTNDCTLDDWLRSTFADTAFGSGEKDAVTRIELLASGDIGYYDMTSEQIKAEYTPYALAQDPCDGYTAGLMWWLTMPELWDGSGEISGPVVWEDGTHSACSCEVTERCGVRPAMWLFADSNNLPAEPVFDGSAPESHAYSSSSGGSSSGSKCPNCNGTGYVRYYYGSSDLEAYLSGHDPYTTGPCTMCNGTGRVH